MSGTLTESAWSCGFRRPSDIPVCRKIYHSDQWSLLGCEDSLEEAYLCGLFVVYSVWSGGVPWLWVVSKSAIVPSNNIMSSNPSALLNRTLQNSTPPAGGSTGVHRVYHSTPQGDFFRFLPLMEIFYWQILMILLRHDLFPHGSSKNFTQSTTFWWWSCHSPTSRFKSTGWPWAQKRNLILTQNFKNTTKILQDIYDKTVAQTTEVRFRVANTTLNLHHQLVVDNHLKSSYTIINYCTICGLEARPRTYGLPSLRHIFALTGAANSSRFCTFFWNYCTR